MEFDSVGGQTHNLRKQFSVVHKSIERSLVPTVGQVRKFLHRFAYTQNISLLSIVPSDILFPIFLSLRSPFGPFGNTSAQLSTNNVFSMLITLQIFSYVSTRNNQIKLNFYCEGNLCKSRGRLRKSCWLATSREMGL